MKSILVSTLIVLCSAMSFGQISTFKILTLSGKSSITIGENENQLKTGMILSGDFALEVGKDSYIGLVHNSGNLLELKEEGIYKARDLYAQASTENKSTLVTKYTDFLLQRMSEDDENVRLAATGAVERSYDPLSKNLRLFIPEMNELYGEEVILEWDDSKAKSTVQVMDMYEEVLYSVDITGKRFILNVNEEQLLNQKMLVLKVIQEGDKTSTPVLIKKVEGATREKHAKNLNDITADISNSALLELIRAAYFEDNRLLADAFTSYVNAMLMEPGVSDYREAYEAFLVRNRLLQNI